MLIGDSTLFSLRLMIFLKIIVYLQHLQLVFLVLERLAVVLLVFYSVYVSGFSICSGLAGIAGRLGRYNFTDA